MIYFQKSFHYNTFTLYIILKSVFLSNRLNYNRFKTILSFFQNVEYKMEKKQIRTIFWFQFKLGRKAAEAARDINEAFGSGTTTERTAQWWFKKFRGGDESLEDDERCGRPSDVDNDQLRALVEANPRTTVRELAAELDVTYRTISNHLREIGKTKKKKKTW